MNKTRKALAALALATLPVVGLLGAHAASADDNATTPAPKASCTWDGATTSDGGYHTSTSGSSWAQYRCDNGSWTKTGSCDGNCNPPPPRTYTGGKSVKALPANAGMAQISR